MHPVLAAYFERFDVIERLSRKLLELDAGGQWDGTEAVAQSLCEVLTSRSERGKPEQRSEQEWLSTGRLGIANSALAEKLRNADRSARDYEKKRNADAELSARTRGEAEGSKSPGSKRPEARERQTKTPARREPKRANRVFVIGSDGIPLMPCTVRRARMLIDAGRVKKRDYRPFTIHLKHRHVNDGKTRVESAANTSSRIRRWRSRRSRSESPPSRSHGRSGTRRAGWRNSISRPDSTGTGSTREPKAQDSPTCHTPCGAPG